MTAPLGAVRLGRRQFVLGGAAILLLTSCSPPTAGKPATISPEAAMAKQVATVPDLIGLPLFYVAHRGSGDNWPEHTLTAYRNAAAGAAHAIEVSVNATADGVLVCHHDRNTVRLTGVDKEIGDVTWSELEPLRNDATEWLGPNVPLEPISKLSDVLDELAPSNVIFIEDKPGTNTSALLDMMDSYPDSRQHFIWKQWAGGTQHEVARSRGYSTWGYLTSDLELTDEVVDSFDYLGVHHSAPDEKIAQLVATGKPVIAWEVHTRAMRDRLTSLGVVGMMCSNVSYVMESAAQAARDAFATGVRTAGDLPWTTDQGWKLQPKIVPEQGSIILDYPDVQSYIMGSLAPIDAANYEISFRLRWPDALPGATQHAGLAFGLSSDQPYRVGVPSTVSGYHTVIRANGLLELFERTSGTARGSLLASVQTPAPEKGEWVDLIVSVSEAGVAVGRDRNPSWRASANDSKHRGGYFWLCKNYAEPIAVEYSAIVVE